LFVLNGLTSKVEAHNVEKEEAEPPVAIRGLGLPVQGHRWAIFAIFNKNNNIFVHISAKIAILKQ